MFRRNIVTRGPDGGVRKLNLSNASWRNWICRKLSKIISSSDVVGYKKVQTKPWDICQATSRCKTESVGSILIAFLNSDIATDINQIET